MKQFVFIVLYLMIFLVTFIGGLEAKELFVLFSWYMFLVIIEHYAGGDPA
ncbi:hypothetical protein [Salinicoccus roseus]|nr:hypothetical protein [Salinicoccus roseus]